MAHGAPDHTQLSDDAFSHYTWKTHTDAAMVLPDAATVELANIDFVGVVAGFFAYSNYNQTRWRVKVDGLLIDTITAEMLYGLRPWPTVVGWSAYNLNRYDPTTPSYVFSWGTNFKCYVHKNLTIDVYQNSGANKEAILYQLTYLDKG